MTNNNNINISSIFVLVADDLPDVIASYESALANYGIVSVAATTLEELDAAFNRYAGILSAIILDGCIPGDLPNTYDFIDHARAAGFDKPIIAASSSSMYRSWMVNGGCSHSSPKEQAVDLVVELLTS